jgi:NAD-dependent deacetylase sirtuin 5
MFVSFLFWLALTLCLQVYPAAGYPSAVKRNGGRIAVFNTERTAGDGSAEFLFLGPCEDTVPKAFGSRY